MPALEGRHRSISQALAGSAVEISLEAKSGEKEDEVLRLREAQPPRGQPKNVSRHSRG